MPFQVSCPTCNRPLRVPDGLPGTQVQCPSCESVFPAIEPERPAGEPPPRRGRESAIAPRLRDRQDEPPIRRRRDDEDWDDDPIPRRLRRDLEPHRATLIIVLGVISIVLAWNTGLGFITGIPAWVMGSIDLGKMKRGEMDHHGKGQTTTGRNLGMAGTILSFFCGIWIGGWLLVSLFG